MQVSVAMAEEEEVGPNTFPTFPLRLSLFPNVPPYVRILPPGLSYSPPLPEVLLCLLFVLLLLLPIFLFFLLFLLLTIFLLLLLLLLSTISKFLLLPLVLTIFSHGQRR